MATQSGISKQARGQKRQSFIQPLTAVIRNHGQLTPPELAVYLLFLTYDWDEQGTWVSQKTTGAELGISERSVRDAVKKLERVGAIECERRPGRSNLCKVKRAWLPPDVGPTCRSKRFKTTPPTPEEPAGEPGNSCRIPRRNLPHTAAGSAAETDTEKYTQKAEARTDPVPTPAASEELLSRITMEASQEQTQEEPTTRLANTETPPPVSSSNNSSPLGFSKESLGRSIGNVDYDSVRLDPAEEDVIVELATKFDHIQMIMGHEKATGIRWQKFLTGFRMMLFSAKHERSYEDVGLVLDYLKDNPLRAKEIINKDNKRGVTNTYHLMFLFDRLHNEAVGREGEAKRMFSQRKVRIASSGPSA